MKRNIQHMTGQTFDLLVIGGGIYGATIAWDATLRGLKVALLEKDDFGHATSANSLKTVHGGLRYLQHADIRRMRESIRERATLMRIAPHLVHPLKCLMPTYGHGLKGPEALRAALLLNDLISFDRNYNVDADKHLPNGAVISRQECLDMLPGVPDEGLNGGAIWYDGQMYNSERLTLSFVVSAARMGAAVANHAAVTGFLRDEKDGRIVGATVHDRLADRSYEIAARVVVNAAGPWVDRVLGLLGQRPLQLGIQLAKAINIATKKLFDGFAVGLKSDHAFKDEDALIDKGGRLFFISPWRDQSLIGTTYTHYDGHPDDFEVTESDVAELLAEINSCYPPAQLTPADVRFVYQGLVPINDVHPETGNVQRAKQYQIVDHGQQGVPGLISVLGVKYTTARDVAEKVVDQVFATIGESPPSRSAATPLHGGDVEQFQTFVEKVMAQRPCALPEAQLRPLLYNYGTAYEDVLRYFERRPAGERPLSDADALLRAQTRYAVSHEMARSLDDVILRRTEIGTAGYPGEAALALCARTMAQELGWSEYQIGEEIRRVQAAFALTTQPAIGVN